MTIHLLSCLSRKPDPVDAALARLRALAANVSPTLGVGLRLPIEIEFSYLLREIQLEQTDRVSPLTCGYGGGGDDPMTEPRPLLPPHRPETPWPPAPTKPSGQ